MHGSQTPGLSFLPIARRPAPLLSTASYGSEEQQFDPQQACKWMVSVLRFAYDYDCENQLAAELLQEERLPELKVLQKRFLRHHAPQPVIASRHAVDTYDQLLNGNWVAQGAVYV